MCCWVCDSINEFEMMIQIFFLKRKLNPVWFIKTQIGHLGLSKTKTDQVNLVGLDAQPM